MPVAEDHNQIATFTLSSGASATVGGTAQFSGTTSNDFSSPVVYTVTAEDGTPQDWTVTLDFSYVGVQSLDAVSVNLYPNPAHSILNVDLKGFNSNVTVSLMSMDGKILVSKQISAQSAGTMNQIDVSGLTTGIYFVQIVNASGKIIKKVMIN